MIDVPPVLGVTGYEVCAEPARGTTYPKREIVFPLEISDKQVGYPRLLNSRDHVGIQKKSNAVLPATIVSELADTVKLSRLSYRTKKSLTFRDVNIRQLGSDKCTYTTGMPIRLHDWRTAVQELFERYQIYSSVKFGVDNFLNDRTYHCGRPWHVCYSNSLPNEAE
jgi:hypothetical protein